MSTISGIHMYGPGASAYNAVTANGKWTNGATLPAGTFFSFHTTTLPKLVMIFNLSNTDDGWCSATMVDPSHVLWATQVYHSYIGADDGDIWMDFRWGTGVGESYIKDGIACISAATPELDEITGFDLLTGGTLIGGVNEVMLYFCLGSFAGETEAGVSGATLADVNPGYHYFDGSGTGLP